MSYTPLKPILSMSYTPIQPSESSLDTLDTFIVSIGAEISTLDEVHTYKTTPLYCKYLLKPLHYTVNTY
jgi:hypothetical protein